MDRRLLRLTVFEKRMVFGLPCQHWTVDDWDELFGELPSGCEFAA